MQVLLIGIIGQTHRILFCIHIACAIIRGRLCPYRHIEGNGRFLCFPFFSRYQNHTICRTGTIHSRRTCIFQDINTTDIVYIDIRHGSIINNTVQNDQRILRGRKRICSTNTQTYILSSISALSSINTGSRSDKSLRQTHIRDSWRIFQIHPFHCACQVFLFHGSISDNHYFFQCFGIFPECYGIGRLIIDFYFLRDISYIRNY